MSGRLLLEDQAGKIMETKIFYSNTVPKTVMAFRNRPCALKKSDPSFEQPSAAEVRALRNLLGCSQVGLAKILGVTYNVKKGSQTVRKWETSEDSKEHRPINYAAWRLMLIAAGVISSSDLIDEVSAQSSNVT